MKKNNRSRVYGTEVLFYMISIFTFVAIGFGSFVKVGTFIYSQDLALLNQMNEDNIVNNLPLTGSPDTDFTLVTLFFIFLFIFVLFFMLKLTKLNLFSKKNKRK